MCAYLHYGNRVISLVILWRMLHLNSCSLRVPESTYSQVLRSTSVDSQSLRASKFFVLKLIDIVILWVLVHHPFGFSLFMHFWVLTVQLSKLHCLAKDH